MGTTADTEQLASELLERLRLKDEEMEALRVLLFEHVNGIERRLDERLRRLEERLAREAASSLAPAAFLRLPLTPPAVGNPTTFIASWPLLAPNVSVHPLTGR